MLAFWRHGYETTSISDLKAATGITAPSLYAAFGDKRALFMEALSLYLGDPDETARLIADAPTALDAARQLLVGSATRFTGRSTPRGCLLATATASCSASSADVQEALAAIRRSINRQLRDRVAKDIDEGALPPGTDAGALADLVMSVIQGLSSLARDGASRPRLLRIVDTTLQAWPASPPRG